MAMHLPWLNPWLGQCNGICMISKLLLLIHFTPCPMSASAQGAQSQGTGVARLLTEGRTKESSFPAPLLCPAPPYSWMELLLVLPRAGRDLLCYRVKSLSYGKSCIIRLCS